MRVIECGVALKKNNFEEVVILDSDDDKKRKEMAKGTIVKVMVMADPWICQRIPDPANRGNPMHKITTNKGIRVRVAIRKIPHLPDGKMALRMWLVKMKGSEEQIVERVCPEHRFRRAAPIVMRKSKKLEQNIMITNKKGETNIVIGEEELSKSKKTCVIHAKMTLNCKTSCNNVDWLEENDSDVKLELRGCLIKKYEKTPIREHRDEDWLADIPPVKLNAVELFPRKEKKKKLVNKYKLKTTSSKWGEVILMSRDEARKKEKLKLLETIKDTYLSTKALGHLAEELEVEDKPGKDEKEESNRNKKKRLMIVMKEKDVSDKSLEKIKRMVNRSWIYTDHPRTRT